MIPDDLWGTRHLRTHRRHLQIDDIGYTGQGGAITLSTNDYEIGHWDADSEDQLFIMHGFEHRHEEIIRICKELDEKWKP